MNWKAKDGATTAAHRKGARYGMGLNRPSIGHGGYLDGGGPAGACEQY